MTDCITTDAHNRLLWAAVLLIVILLIYLLIRTVNISKSTCYIFHIVSKSLLPSNRTLFSTSVLYLIVTVRPIECRLPLFEQVHWITGNTRLQIMYKLRLWQLVGRAAHSDWLPNLECACSTAPTVPVIRFKASPLRAGEGVQTNDVTCEWNDTATHGETTINNYKLGFLVPFLIISHMY